MKNNILANHDFVVHFVPEPKALLSVLYPRNTLSALRIQFALKLNVCITSILKT
jgi:hypothetical protein